MTISFTTLSGKPLSIGTGTGTKWQWHKKGLPEEQKGKLVEELVDQVVMSIENGFRYIDTADNYTTQPEVGEAIKRSGVPREDIFLSTKYFPGLFYHELSEPIYGDGKGPLEILDKCLKELKTDYLDLYLIHFPFFEFLNGYTLEAAWKEMVQALDEGKVRHIGVCNFAIPHLETCLRATGVMPEVNQIEFHPYLQNQTKDIVKYCLDHDILLESFGSLTPIFRIDNGQKEVKDHPLVHVLPQLSAKYGKTEAQILLRYTLQMGLLPVTTTSKPQRVRETLEVYDFQLQQDDVDLISNEGRAFKFRGFFGEMYKDFV